MIDFDLDRVFSNEPDYPWLEVTNAISAVDEYLTLLDEHLPYISDQTKLRFVARLEKAASEMHPDDLDLEIHRVKTVTEEIVPLFFYGSFIISLWAAFEVAVNELTTYARNKSDARLQLNDLREQNTRRRLELYLSTITRRPLAIPEVVSEKIENLQDVRNCLAHANGDLRQQRDDRRKRIELLAQKDSGISTSGGRLIASAKFARASLDAVVAYVNALFAQLHETFPLKSAEG